MSLDTLIIVLSLIFSAFFSGMEIAFVSSNKIHIEIEKKQRGFLSLLLTKITAKPSKFIATMLIGNNIALVVYGLYMGDVLVAWFSQHLPTDSTLVYYLFNELSLLTQTIISTLVILISAEFLPKVFFQIYANSLLKLLALPAFVFYILFSLFSDFVIWISDFVLKTFFKTKGDDVQLAFTKVDLGNYISEQMQSVEADDEVDSEIIIFQNALEFSEVKAREAMVPRTELTAIEIHDTIENLSKLFTQTGHSKIVVYKSTIDDILGYVHAFDLFKNPKTIKSMLMPIEFVPETMLAKDILNVLTKKHKSLAVVLDEYGGTSGILTVEDIVEELFGEIEDEHDSVALIEEQMDQLNFLFSARLEVDYLNETYKLQLPEHENYETLGGLIVHHTQEIPEQNQQISIDRFLFTIQEVSNTKIELIALKIEPQD
ncbi:hemolysin [Formosa sp. Hel3_A1_48]|jgi:CBS domain containing-hemolysin-like protein|uniref:hemolysin family protein n=1 Tax=Formosa sp. Hel3_A1_48 TaxID=1336795 RepID=UPI00084E2E77|nr:hemolysin family protein [Formosa sp. Hel3_A1_48]MDA9760216.1 hemolysin family protein [Flavobacteriaceae bacterium]AOR25603.1 hemolysin [Formosa sp. Hel3_A1_48]MDC0950219.1 hemolysin family protein [Flavobacteriaceae bacterium]MDG1673349.1 hemolysin family protein [Flavobacteriaceae bacterium]MDG2484484.1 hemolysin family protein [Flavobacteriaceae bacterium]